MEPRFNIRVADMQGGDPNFQDPNQEWVGDMNSNVNDFNRNMNAVQTERAGLAAQLDKNTQQRGESMTHNPAQDEMLMVMEPGVANTPDLSEIPAGAKPQLGLGASKLAAQVDGFNNAQSRADFTMGVVANVGAGTLVNSRVVVETPTTKIAGTVLAVGDREFAVVWDDRTASVERKSDYELVVAE